MEKQSTGSETHFSFHRKQSEAWKHVFIDNKRTTALISGVQGGKSIFGAFALRHHIDHNKDPHAAWIVGTPSYKILQQSTLPTFMKVFGTRNGVYKSQEQRYVLKDGRSVFFRTSTNPESLEGVPDAQFCWLDEAGNMSRRFWVNAEARLARRQGQLLLTTTWYSLNWLYKSIWQPYIRGERDDIGLVYFNSAENPTFPREELERQRFILSRAEYSRKFLGEPAKPEGLIFPTFDRENWVEPFNIDYKRVPTYMGLDYGFDHPMALVIRALPGDGNCYTVSIYKKSGLSVLQQLDAIKSKCSLFHINRVFGGHDRPDILLELNKLGIPAQNYFEGQPEHREVNVGNQMHDELIRSKRYKCFKDIEGCEDLEDEYLTYSWEKNESDEQTEKEKPVNVNDDLMAAERYCTVGTKHLMKDNMISIPKIPNRFSSRIDEFDPEEVEDKAGSWQSY